MAQGTFQATPDHATNGATLVAAITGYRFEILELTLTADATGRVKILQGSTIIWAAEVVAGGGAIKPPNGYPLTDFVSGTGQALTLVTTNSANVSGYIIYKQVAVTPGV